MSHQVRLPSCCHTIALQIAEDNRDLSLRLEAGVAGRRESITLMACVGSAFWLQMERTSSLHPITLPTIHLFVTSSLTIFP